jgi:hypothetical protein
MSPKHPGWCGGNETAAGGADRALSQVRLLLGIVCSQQPSPQSRAHKPLCGDVAADRRTWIRSQSGCTIFITHFSSRFRSESTLVGRTFSPKPLSQKMGSFSHLLLPSLLPCLLYMRLAASSTVMSHANHESINLAGVGYAHRLPASYRRHLKLQKNFGLSIVLNFRSHTPHTGQDLEPRSSDFITPPRPPHAFRSACTGAQLKWSSATLPLFVLALALFSAGLSHAATIQWTGPANGVWTENTNWQGGLAPTATDDVVINAAGMVDVNANVEVKALTLLAGSIRILSYAQLCPPPAPPLPPLCPLSYLVVYLLLCLNHHTHTLGRPL